MDALAISKFDGIILSLFQKAGRHSLAVSTAGRTLDYRKGTEGIELGGIRA